MSGDIEITAAAWVADAERCAAEAERCAVVAEGCAALRRPDVAGAEWEAEKSEVWLARAARAEMCAAGLDPDEAWAAWDRMTAQEMLECDGHYTQRARRAAVRARRAAWLAANPNQEA